MTDPNLTHLVLVLDRSGSMLYGGKHVEAEKGVRALLEEQAALPGRLEVTVARFDDKYELLCTACPADLIRHNDLVIEPRGMTALYDAVGRTVVRVGAVLAARRESDRPGRIIVLVATDGAENASSEYNATTLRTLIERQSSIYGWEFVFMGTSQEALLQAMSVGFKMDTSYVTSDTAAGVSSSYNVASSTISRARTYGAAVKVTDEDRAQLA